MMKSVMLATACLLAIVPHVQAGTKTLPECDSQQVENTFTRVAHVGNSTIATVIQTTNVKSNDPTESRFCRSEALTTSGRMYEFIYELRWTSETDNRFWLQVKGGRAL